MYIPTILRRMAVFAAVILSLVNPVLSQVKTKPLRFDSAGRLLSSPYSYSFDPEDYNGIQVDVTNLADSVLKQLRDTLLARADLLRQQIDVYRDIWLSATYDKLMGSRGNLGQLENWKRYLRTDWGPNDAITFFPLLPDTRTFKKSSFLLVNDEKTVIRPADPAYTMVLTPDSPWVVDGLHPQVRFRLVFQDLFRNVLIQFYNRSLTPDLLHMNTDQLSQRWNNEWMPGLKRLKEKECDLDMPAKDLLDQLSDPAYRSANPSEILIQLIKDEADLHQRFVTYFKDDPAITFFRNNETFFVKWLWFNKGVLTIDPFSFTTPGKLSSALSAKDRLDSARAALFNVKYIELASCDICKTYQDTLTIRDLAKQQNRGMEYFPRADSVRLADSNKLAFQNFQRALTTFHSFSYPYRNPGDSMAIVQQFDAARKYKRVDSLPLSFCPALFRRIKRADNFIPDNRSPAISVRNIPFGTYLRTLESTSAVKDQSSFQKILSDSAGIGGAGALASLLASSSIAHFGTVPVLPVVLPHEGQLYSHKLAPDKTTADNVTILLEGDHIDIKILPDHTIDDCSGLIEKILERYIVTNQIMDAGGLIGQFKADPRLNARICTFTDAADLEKKIGIMLGNFAGEFAKIDQPRQDAIREISNDTALINRLLKMKIQAPPDTLVADNKTLADTGAYRTDVIYLNQAQSLSKDAFAVYKTTIKDTISKQIAGGFFALAPRHLVLLGIGPEVTAGKVPVNTITSSGGQLNISQDVQIVRFLVGLHIYPWKLFNPDNRFFFHQHYGVSSWSRASIFLGTAFPTPLQNFYAGLGVDLVPGLRISTGYHLIWYTRYKILNNQVSDQASALRYGGWYFGLTIDPMSISSAILNAFK